MHKIPRNPAWCSYCRNGEPYGHAGKPCPEHTGRDGAFTAYAGPDAYNPSPWVTEVVGSFFKSINWHDVKQDPPMDVFICDGYDPRHGFWMKDLRTGKCRNISERAVDVNFHRVRPATYDFSRRDPYYVLAVSLHL